MDDYTTRRLRIVEAALRNLMALVIETQPPYYAQQIDRMGREWDKQLDALDAEAGAAPAHPGEGGTGA